MVLAVEGLKEVLLAEAGVDMPLELEESRDDRRCTAGLRGTASAGRAAVWVSEDVDSFSLSSKEGIEAASSSRPLG